MNMRILVACLVTGIATPVIVHATDTSAKPAAAPLKETATIERRATITGIDAANRLVTLKGQDGDEFVVEAGSEVRNFDQLKVGDMVVGTYTESLAVDIAAPGTAVPGVKSTVTGTPSPGQRSVGREVTATLKVEAVDASQNTVKLSDGAGRSRTIDVVRPEGQARLKTLKPGDMVVITYTESLALRLEKVATK